jgi:hypothetical protein
LFPTLTIRTQQATVHRPAVDEALLDRGSGPPDCQVEIYAAVVYVPQLDMRDSLGDARLEADAIGVEPHARKAK